tara:strand:- start:734 stop:964 length:231 start_codon:yes stop_codon:yes gene_type:complete
MFSAITTSSVAFYVGDLAPILIKFDMERLRLICTVENGEFAFVVLIHLTEIGLGYNEFTEGNSLFHLIERKLGMPA